MGPLFSAAFSGIVAVLVGLVAFLIFRTQRLPFKLAVCSAVVFVCGGAACAFLVLVLTAIVFHDTRTNPGPFIAYFYLCLLGVAGILGGVASVRILRRFLTIDWSDRGR